MQWWVPFFELLTATNTHLGLPSNVKQPSRKTTFDIILIGKNEVTTIPISVGFYFI
jgi:hypothetical protein